MRIHELLSTLLFASTLSITSFAQAADIPAPSIWKLNPAASNFGGGPQPTSEVITVMTNNKTSLSWKEVITDSNGTRTVSWSGAPDGTPRPVAGAPGEMASFTDQGYHVQTTDGEMVDGTTVLSEDGKSIVQTSTVKTRDGNELHLKLVFDRIK